MIFGRDRRPARWELVTRQGCHLCDEMAAELERAGIGFTSVDVDRDEELRARFGEERWSNFVADHHNYTRDTSVELWENIRRDHGYNPTPAWTFVARLFAAKEPSFERKTSATLVSWVKRLKPSLPVALSDDAMRLPLQRFDLEPAQDRLRLC